MNIAPLTFEYDGKADGIVARLTAGNEEVVCGGSMIQPSMDEWHQLVQAAINSRQQTAGEPSALPAIQVEVYLDKYDRWTRYKPFNIYVSTDSIDPYISYRLIPPSYVVYEDLTINQRCLENYDESVVYDNMLCSDGGDKGQCINCHNYHRPMACPSHSRVSRPTAVFSCSHLLIMESSISGITTQTSGSSIYTHRPPDH